MLHWIGSSLFHLGGGLWNVTVRTPFLPHASWKHPRTDHASAADGSGQVASDRLSAANCQVKMESQRRTHAILAEARCVCGEVGKGFGELLRVVNVLRRHGSPLDKQVMSCKPLAIRRQPGGPAELFALRAGGEVWRPLSKRRY